MQRIGGNDAVGSSTYAFINEEDDGPDGAEGSDGPKIKQDGDTFDQPTYGRPAQEQTQRPTLQSPQQGTIFAPDPLLLLLGVPPPPPSSTPKTVEIGPYSAGSQGQLTPSAATAHQVGQTTINSRTPEPPAPVSQRTLTGRVAQTASMLSPREMAESARGRGLRASVTHGSSLKDIARMVNHGAPPIALIDTGDGSNPQPAYVTISGYGTDAKGGITTVTITDVTGKQKRMSVSEFEKRWSGVELDQKPYDRTLISTLPKGNQALRSVDGTSCPADTINLPTQNAQTAAPQDNAGGGAANLFADLFKGIGDFFSSFFGALFKSPSKEQG
jgi:hypothetical protein